MTYYLYDVDGYVGDLASAYGLTLMSDFARTNSNSQAVKQFFLEGYSQVIQELIEGIKALESSDRSIQITLDNLIELLGKSKEVAIISDGMTS